MNSVYDATYGRRFIQAILIAMGGVPCTEKEKRNRNHDRRFKPSSSLWASYHVPRKRREKKFRKPIVRQTPQNRLSTHPSCMVDCKNAEPLVNASQFPSPPAQFMISLHFKQPPSSVGVAVCSARQTRVGHVAASASATAPAGARRSSAGATSVGAGRTSAATTTTTTTTTTITAAG